MKATTTPDMDALFQFVRSDPELNAMYRKHALQYAPKIIQSLLDMEDKVWEAPRSSKKNTDEGDISVTAFGHLMANDLKFRKAVTSKAALCGMTLYQSASQLASATATAPIKPSPKSMKKVPPKKRKLQRGRLKGNDLAQARKDNAAIRVGILRALSKGRVTTDQLRKQLTPKTSLLLKNKQHLTNNLSKLINNGQIRKADGTKAPNSQWEAVPRSKK